MAVLCLSIILRVLSMTRHPRNSHRVSAGSHWPHWDSIKGKGFCVPPSTPPEPPAPPRAPAAPESQRRIAFADPGTIAKASLVYSNNNEICVRTMGMFKD